MIVICDYGMGNLNSIKNMLSFCGYSSEISSNPDVVRAASLLILPGVGAFDSAVNAIARLKLAEALTEVSIVRKAPTLGICLGMQLLFESSEEGQAKGLGFVPGQVRSLPNDLNRIPHIGWAPFSPPVEEGFLKSLGPDLRFYFVHKYACFPSAESKVIVSELDYGVPFASAVELGNIVGVQFHPEKSHKFGIHFFKTYLSFFNVAQDLS